MKLIFDHKKSHIFLWVVVSVGIIFTFQNCGNIRIDKASEQSASQIPPGPVVYSDASAFHLCIINQLNKLKCFGENSHGQIGDGSKNFAREMKAVDVNETYAQVSLGRQSTCGITTSGALKCWGTYLGDISRPEILNPQVLDAGTTYSQVSAGGNLCAITTSGVLKCWGNSRPATYPYFDPVVMDAGTLYKKVIAKDGTSCGITVANDVKCWGSNDGGILGTNLDLWFENPTLVDSGTKYLQITMDRLLPTLCGVTTAKKLKCWGSNTFGQIGNGTVNPDVNVQVRIYTPLLLDADTDYLQVSLGHIYSCRLTTVGLLKCSGNNALFVMGGDYDYRGAPHFSPIAIDANTAYANIATNINFACGVTEASLLKCWGTTPFGIRGAPEVVAF